DAGVVRRFRDFGPGRLCRALVEQPSIRVQPTAGMPNVTMEDIAMAFPTLKRATAETQSTDPALSILGEALITIAITVALLIPCLWQEHVQAGDLSSHVYNAWLAGEIEHGRAKELRLTTPLTNLAADLALQFVMQFAGPSWAERIVAGLSVLIFFWGTFAMVGTATGRWPWLMAPTLGMLAYGLAFHLGFLNFYLSTGLCLWVISLLWRPTLIKALISAPLIALAIFAHALPVAWMGAALTYVHTCRKIPAKLLPAMLLPGVASLVALQAAIVKFFPIRWTF